VLQSFIQIIGMACSYFLEFWAIMINLCLSMLSIMICTNVVRTNGLRLTFYVSVSVKLCKSILCCVVNVNININTHIVLHDHLKIIYIYIWFYAPCKIV